MNKLFTNIFKKEKLQKRIPEPDINDMLEQKLFEEKIKEGVHFLHRGKEIHIHDDGRGHELAIKIKNQFMVDHINRLSERIEIIDGNPIIIRGKNASFDKEFI